MLEIAAAFEAEHPGVKVVREASGSRAAARKITDLGRKCDVMVSADYTVIDELLLGEHASWTLLFATNEMVLAYSVDLPRKQVPTPDNWTQLVTAKGVRVGLGDPNSDPCGYRALMVLQLAETELPSEGLYSSVKERAKGHIRPKASDLIALLEVGELDYAFLYRSVAMQHGIPFLPLPDSINLKDPQRTREYGSVSVAISGPEPGSIIKKTGGPVAYGITIPLNAPHPELALDFVEFLVQKEHGLAIFQNNGQPSLVPSSTASFNHLQERLRAYASPQK